MEFLKSIKYRNLRFELKLRYALKTLPIFWKAVLSILVATFIVSGLVLAYDLDQKLSAYVPAKGGVLKEGIVGTPRFINPVLATSDPDRDLVALIYSGLTRAGENNLIMDLAEKYEVSEDGLCYTFLLKPDLKWSDGENLTTNDIIFTLDLIKNPQTKSPKRASWEGVMVEKINDRSISFCLQKPYAPFLENTTLGILPQHIWQDILPEQMPLSTFNIEAMGSGPFKIKNITRNSSGIITSYTLAQNKNFTLEKPYLDKIIFKFYPSEKKLIEAYEKNEIDSLSAISPQDALKIQKEKSVLKTYQLPRVFAVFFNQDTNPLFAKAEVREALNLSVNKNIVVEQVLSNFGVPINGPIPPGSLGYVNLKPGEYENFEAQFEEAKKILEKNNWKLNNEENVLEKKNGKETIKLEFSLSTSNVPDLVNTAQVLKEMWGKIGAKVNIKVYEIGDLEQNVIRPRKYDSLLFGEIMGKDPDAFAFWHSSQRNDPGLNVALYANITTDKLLEDARTTFNTEERKTKYEEFQKEIASDIPAVFIYSPYFIHVIPESLDGVNQNFITISSDRFSQIYNWHLNTKKIWTVFLDY